MDERRERINYLEQELGSLDQHVEYLVMVEIHGRSLAGISSPRLEKEVVNLTRQRFLLIREIQQLRRGRAREPARERSVEEVLEDLERERGIQVRYVSKTHYPELTNEVVTVSPEQNIIIYSPTGQKLEYQPPEEKRRARPPKKEKEEKEIKEKEEAEKKEEEAEEKAEAAPPPPPLERQLSIEEIDRLNAEDIERNDVMPGLNGPPPSGPPPSPPTPPPLHPEEKPPEEKPPQPPPDENVRPVPRDQDINEQGQVLSSVAQEYLEAKKEARYFWRNLWGWTGRRLFSRQRETPDQRIERLAADFVHVRNRLALLSAEHNLHRRENYQRFVEGDEDLLRRYRVEMAEIIMRNTEVTNTALEKSDYEENNKGVFSKSNPWLYHYPGLRAIFYGGLAFANALAIRQGVLPEYFQLGTLLALTAAFEGGIHGVTRAFNPLRKTRSTEELAAMDLEKREEVIASYFEDRLRSGIPEPDLTEQEAIRIQRERLRDLIVDRLQRRNYLGTTGAKDEDVILEALREDEIIYAENDELISQRKVGRNRWIGAGAAAGFFLLPFINFARLGEEWNRFITGLRGPVRVPQIAPPSNVTPTPTQTPTPTPPPAPSAGPAGTPTPTPTPVQPGPGLVPSPSGPPPGFSEYTFACPDGYFGTTMGADDISSLKGFAEGQLAINLFGMPDFNQFNHQQVAEFTKHFNENPDLNARRVSALVDFIQRNNSSALHLNNNPDLVNHFTTWDGRHTFNHNIGDLFRYRIPANVKDFLENVR